MVAILEESEVWTLATADEPAAMKSKGQHGLARSDVVVARVRQAIREEVASKALADVTDGILDPSFR